MIKYYFSENRSSSLGESRELSRDPACASKTRHVFSHQQANGGEADVELLVLQAEAAGYIHYDLEAGARHGGQEVCHHQLQALEGCSDQ